MIWLLCENFYENSQRIQCPVLAFTTEAAVKAETDRRNAVHGWRTWSYIGPVPMA